MANMTLLTLMAVVLLSGGARSFAYADAACEKKILDTKMIYTKDDPKIICDQNPSPAAQQCLVDVLAASKGKLRNSDLFHVFGLCKTDPAMKDCLIRGLDQPWNAPGYKGARAVGVTCINAKYNARIAAHKADEARRAAKVQPRPTNSKVSSGSSRK